MAQAKLGVEIRALLADELYEDAALLCAFVDAAPGRPAAAPSAAADDGGASPSSVAVDDPLLQVEHLVLYGDALRGCGELRRACALYERAAEDQRQAAAAGLAGVSDACTGAPLSADDLRLRIAECLFATNERKRCIKVLESLDTPAPPAKWALRLARLYEDECNVARATAAYAAVVRARPLCVAAAAALVRLGGKKPPATVSRAARGVGVALADAGLPRLARLLEGDAHMAALAHKSAIEVYESLLTPAGGAAAPGAAPAAARNAVVLRRLAHAQLQHDDASVAQRTYEWLRECDPLCVDGADELAWILRQRCHGAELAALAYAVMQAAPDRPEAWTAAALYADHNQQRDRAVELTQHALSLAPRHACAHLVDGTLALGAGRLWPAVQAFHRAHRADPAAIQPYCGLVDAYLSARDPQLKHALLTAKEALVRMPTSPRALSLVGRVLSRTAEGRSKAANAFKRALRIDPMCMEALVEGAKLLVLDKKYDEAAAMLARYVDAGERDFADRARAGGGAQDRDEADPQGAGGMRAWGDAAAATRHNIEYVRVKLGNVYALCGNHHQALVHYHRAAGQFAFAPALQAIERLEQLREVQAGAQAFDDGAMAGDGAY